LVKLLISLIELGGVLLHKYNSYWIKSTSSTDYPTLSQDINVDCLVIGGGITGITTAYLLQQEGLKTVLIEKDRICLGTTGHTTGKITSCHNLIYSHLIDTFGKQLAKQYADANQQAIRTITKLVNDNNIDCDFSTHPSYVYTTDKNNIARINKELVAALSLGLPVEFVDSTDLPFGIEGGLRYHDQAQFHPRKYIIKLAELFVNNGGAIYENTKAINLDPNTSQVTTRNNTITAKNIIIATHYPFYAKGHMYFAKMSPYTSYVTGIKGDSILKKGMYISCDHNTRSFRYVDSDEKLLLFGGQSHKTGQSEDELSNVEILQKYAQSLYTDVSIKYNWSTQDYITVDLVPYIGLLNNDYDNIYVGTGYGKWGMTNGTVAGLIIKDLITTGTSPYKDIYNPSRSFTLNSMKNIYADTINSSGEFITSRFKISKSHVENIRPAEGKIIKIDNKKIGVYRDTNNKLYMLNTTCPHMKCKVQWNEVEKTWDCPCHGSRFSYDGTFIDGPANKDLEKISIDDL
jgi:glycine/D-amino acid oxidase-like deaminating enzyme/nitrite reductase/ring-hydroxylating ferredoxin subunit